jgi:SAM-dependent methyltransferase
MNLKGERPEKFGAVAAFFYRRWAEPTLAPLHRRIASEVPIEDGRLLDVGCGPGKLDRLLATSRPKLQVVGIDSSPAMIRQAVRGPRPPNLEFREGAVEKAGFHDEFDFALSVLSFHHWEEPVAGLDAVEKALRPGAQFWIYEGDPEASLKELRRDQAPLWGWLRIPERLLRKGLRGHGFTLSEVERFIRPVAAESSFRTCHVARAGSTLRISLTKARLTPGPPGY